MSILITPYRPTSDLVDNNWQVHLENSASHLVDDKMTMNYVQAKKYSNVSFFSAETMWPMYYCSVVQDVDFGIQRA